MDLFLREFVVEASMQTDVVRMKFMVTSPKAYVDNVTLRREYHAEGEGYHDNFHIAVRDQGAPTKVNYALEVVFVRRLNDLVPLPDDCGKCLGYLQSSAARIEHYVFASRNSPQRASSSSEETTSPQHGTDASKLSPRLDASACACVTDGPTVHESARESGVQKIAEAVPPDDWGFPSELLASGE